MSKKWTVLCLVLLTALLAGAAAAEEASQSEAALLAELFSAPGVCEAGPAVDVDNTSTELLFDIGVPQLEACFPAECGSGAPPGCPTLPGCCKFKCCVC